MFKNKIIRDTIMLTFMQLILDSASLLLNGFITRKLGASAMGIFTLMGAFIGLAGIVSNGNAFLCTSRLISEELGKPQGNPNRILFHGIRLCTILSIAASAVILLFSQPIGERFFCDSSVVSALRLMPAALFSGAVSCCFKGYFNACRKASCAAAGDILEFAVKSAVIVSMTLMTSDHSHSKVCTIMISSIIAGNIISLLFMGIMFAKHRLKCSQKCSLTFRKYARFAFPIMGGGILTSVLSSSNDALVPFCLRQYGSSPEHALALFGIFEAIVIPALFFPSVVLCSMSGIIVTESARASAAGNSLRVKSITERLIRYTLIYGIFSAAILIRFGRPIGKLLGGGELGGSMIPAIAPVVPFIYMEIVLEALIKGLGLQAFSSINYLAEYVIRISAVLILVPRFGFAGIAVSYYASNIFGNISRLIKLLRHTGVRFRLFKMLLSPILYAVLTMSASELVCRIIPLKNESISYMIVFASIWLAVYFGVFLLSSRLSPKQSPKIFVHNPQENTLKVI